MSVSFVCPVIFVMPRAGVPFVVDLIRCCRRTHTPWWRGGRPQPQQSGAPAYNSLGSTNAREVHKIGTFAVVQKATGHELVNLARDGCLRAARPSIASMPGLKCLPNTQKPPLLE